MASNDDRLPENDLCELQAKVVAKLHEPKKKP